MGVSGKLGKVAGGEQGGTKTSVGNNRAWKDKLSPENETIQAEGQ